MTLPQIAFSQLFTKQEEVKQWVFGFHTAGITLKERDPDTFEKTYFYHIETEPHLSYYPIANLGIGIMYNFVFNRSDYTKCPSAYSYGIYLRYFVPVKFNKKFVNRMNFFIECDYNKTNFKVTTMPFTTGYFAEYPTVITLERTLISIPLGFQFRFWRNFYAECSFEPRFYSDKDIELGSRIGIEYHINRKTE